MFSPSYSSRYHVSLTSNATEAGIGQEVNITVTLDGTPCPALNLSNALLDGKVGTPADVAMITRLREVELMIIGTAYWSGGSGDLAPVYRKTPAPGERVPPPDSLPFPDFVRYGLSAWASFIVQGEGPVVVQANSIYDSNGRYGGAIPRDQGAYIFFNTGSNCNPASSVTTLKLRPAKAYRHTHDSITLTAVARDINGTPVRGATVVFAVHGDCHPRTTQPNSVVTNGAGEAFFKVVADEPGAVTVVAATLGASGIPVVSEASVIFFFTHHHHHREEREKRFYASETEAYAAAAAQLAKEQLV